MFMLHSDLFVFLRTDVNWMLGVLLYTVIKKKVQNVLFKVLKESFSVIELKLIEVCWC